MDGYRPGAAQDFVTIQLPAGSMLPQVPLHDLAEAVFVATKVPGAGFHDGLPGAREVASALTNRRRHAARGVARCRSETP
jgi:hypothetical protein